MRSVNEVLPSGARSAVLLRELADAVSEAGNRALEMRRAGVESWKKSGDSIVCDADIAVDALLRQRLTALAPEVGWLSEETVDAPPRLGLATLWIVDPIDGTRAYLAGDADWGVSAALVTDGRPVAAAFCAPVGDELFLAATGTGATRNGVSIRAAASAMLATARIAGPRPMLDRLATHAAGLQRVPRIRSLALRLTRVASGEIDAALASTDSNDWDLAAADLLVHEAGGLLTGFDGRVPRYNRPETVHGPLVAAPRALHPALLELVRTSLHGAPAP